TIYAELVREAERYPSSGSCRDLCRLAERVLRFGAVEKIALKEYDAGRADYLWGNLSPIKMRADAETGVHRPLPVGSDEDERSSCGKVGGRGGGCSEMDAR